MIDENFEGALGALAHETRVRILRELADSDRPLSFTELKSRADVADPGRFSYHLNELCEHYLAETPDGYDLNHRGERLIVVADRGVDLDGRPGESPGSGGCPVCGEADCDRLIHVHLRGDTGI